MNKQLFDKTCDEHSNALVHVTRLFYPSTAGMTAPPQFAELLLVFADSSSVTITLPIERLTAAAITKAVPRFRVKHKHRDAFEEELLEEVDDIHNRLAAGLLQPVEGRDAAAGFAFAESGLHCLPDGNRVFVWGDRVLGHCKLPCYIMQASSWTPNTAPLADPLPRLLTELIFSSPQVTLAFVYLVATLLRSWIREFTNSWQAVLNIVGGQGLGKTTLARRLTDWIRNDQNDPAFLFSAGSTPTAIRDAMVDARDLPMVIDDLCLSASSQLQRKYRDLGAQFVREGANEVPIAKKLPGGKTVSLKCCAGIILTAEFALENGSDITRCVFINVNRPLDLPSSLTPGLIGAACQSFIEWFFDHEPQARQLLMDALQRPTNSQVHQRIWNNFTILDGVFQLLCFAANEAGMALDTIQLVRKTYVTAKDESYTYQKSLLDKLDAQRKKGNLAAVLLAGFEKDAFKLAKKIEKLEKCDGIIWKDDLCLRREALVRFVRLQNGYGTYTINTIVQELKDIGALVIQEEDTAQVKLKKGMPRVYRICLDILEETAEEYT